VAHHAVDAAALGRLADAGVLAALVDACAGAGVPERVLARFPEGGACLYQGPDALAFRDRAPYVVRVDREVLAWLAAPAGEGGLGGTPWGVFVVGDAPFAALVRHWRGWLTVAAPVAPDAAPGAARESWTFRFYDPRLAPVFLEACDPAEVAAFFGPARSLVVPAWEAPPGTEGAAAGRMLTPGLAARGGAARRAVGERFPLRQAHVAAFQRRTFGDALVAGIGRESAATGQRAWRDPAEPAAGDVLVSGAGAGAPPLRLGFDALGFVGPVTSPLGRRWTVASDARGRPLRLGTPSGAAVDLRYDAAGEVERVTRRAGGAEQLVFTAEHDAAGRPTRTAYADGTARTTVYAAPPLPVAPGGDVPAFDPGVLDPTGARPAAETDRLGRTTRYAYDADGDLAAVTDPLGRTTHYAYGRWRQPSAVTHPDGRCERYGYDAEGRLAALDAGDGVVVRVEMDDAGRQARLASDGRRASPSGPGGPADPGVAPAVAAFARDAAGRVTAATTEPPPAAAGATATLLVPTAATFAYDDAGRVLADVATVGAFGPHVPGDGDAPNVGAARPGGAPAPGGAPLRTAVGYAYDAQGTLVGLTYPTGEAVGFERDADARLTAVTDWSGRRYAIAYADGEAGWTLTTPEGLAVVTRQNAFGRPVATEAVAADGRVLFAAETGYGPEDRVAGVDDSRLGAWRYASDAEGQLVACDGPTPAECARYAYDAAGNRVAVREGPAAADDALPAEAVAVDAGDRLLAQGALRLAYDAAGRAVARDDDAGLGAGGTWRYAYDARGQLLRAWGRGRDGVLRALAFAYDAFGRRVWKLAVERAPGAAGLAARRTRFVWAGEQCVREVAEAAAWSVPNASSGAAAPGADPLAAAAALLDAAMPRGAAWRAVEARDTLYWPGTPTPLLLRVTPASGAAETYLYHVDHLGAPVRLTDAAGRVVWEVAYAPFGAARETVAVVSQPWRRPGQYWDAELGLCYNRLRYYDPRLGRYLTPDPARPLGGWHAYRYAGNAPLDDADPLGLWPSLGTVVAAVAAVAVAVAVVALAPVALPLAIIGAGIAAGAAFGLLNEGLNNGFGCLSCLAGATLKGAAVGGLSALPFAFLPAAAGVAAFAGVGAGSGAIGYTADWALNGANPGEWSWRGFAGSVAFGAVTAGGGRYLQVRGAARTRTAEQAATRQRVLGNIEQSRRARAASNFGEHAARERAATAARAGDKDYGAAFFGRDNYDRFYSGEQVSIGGPGARSFSCRRRTRRSYATRTMRPATPGWRRPRRAPTPRAATSTASVFRPAACRFASPRLRMLADGRTTSRAGTPRCVSQDHASEWGEQGGNLKGEGVPLNPTRD
jgi:RHS repeat-associated protein